MPQRLRTTAATLAIGSMAISLVLSTWAFAHTLALGHGDAARQFANFNWFQLGSDWLKVGWVLDPLTAVMLVMVTFVGLLIFIYSTGYMAEDENFTRFFCFLALFAGAMLGVVISNNLLLLFMCWEVVGLTSYLLIGFWYDKPSATAAAKKAFLVTRIGDLGFFLGMAWLYAQTGTLLFFDNGAGCLEHSALTALVAHTTIFGMTVSTGIAILIFCGAAGKSGQVPLHVWLPDAMEGPTPVSALIHAATMVAAGVFLVARVYPLMSAHVASLPVMTPTIALQVVTWVGAITALFGALVAVAQFDIKRILAYSTVSQLGYMMIGLGVGGISIGMFHLITHAFFKALLFLGAGSVIHGSDGEQDIRRMGGLGKLMPVTFVTYACGMLALSGFPLFSGFWSKDEILHSAFGWTISRAPFYMAAVGALLTAFYMTRQVYYVFAGDSRRRQQVEHDSHELGTYHHAHTPHESPAVMTGPLAILAVFAVGLGFVGTVAWPWFQAFLGGEPLELHWLAFADSFPVMLSSSLLVFTGLGVGWVLYGRKRIVDVDAPDVLELAQPRLFKVLYSAFYVDDFYHLTIVPLTTASATLSDWLDRWIWSGAVRLVSGTVFSFALLDNFVDTYVVNAGFDEGCETVSRSARVLSLMQNGRVQNYLRVIGIALIALVIFLAWGQKA
jgi:NADH-quinone oxidoreductase subunit L